MAKHGRTMRIMVSRMTYRKITQVTHGVEGLVLNDLVSSTRLDPNGVEHQYGTRFDICTAALRATGGEPVRVRVCDDQHYDNPIVCWLMRLHGVAGGGISFVADFNRGWAK